MSLSRRDFFSRLLPRIKAEPPSRSHEILSPTPAPPPPMPPESAGPAGEEPQAVVPPGTSTFAVISGRFCLAYQGTPCSLCHEQCPEPGAIEIDDGLPRVVIDLCTGCQVCHQVCPAPNNAVRLVPRKT